MDRVETTTCYSDTNGHSVNLGETNGLPTGTLFYMENNDQKPLVVLDNTVAMKENRMAGTLSMRALEVIVKIDGSMHPNDESFVQIDGSNRVRVLAFGQLQPKFWKKHLNR